MKPHGSRWKVAAAAVACSGAWLAWAAASTIDAAEEKAGGDTTVFEVGRNAFSFPVANLDEAGRTTFAIGNSFFRRNWVEAPSSTTARDGLGPHFLARSCGGCHVQDGRGAPPNTFRNGLATEQPIALLFRLSVMGADGKPQPEPTYGHQFTVAAAQGVKAEGKVRIQYTEVPGKFADGTRYSLRRPAYSFTSLGYGPMAPKTLVSPRIAPQMIGMGLLEAITEQDIVQNARDQAARSDAIRGMPNRVFDVYANREVIGRFGWKANAGSVAHQTASAFNGDIGITSAHFPLEECMPRQTDCAVAPRGTSAVLAAPAAVASAATAERAGTAPKGTSVEIDDATLEKVIAYTATLAVPARRNFDGVDVRRGQALFNQAQCAVCHRPSYTTGESPFPSLSRQKIYPYTDLLLHDMGSGLADGRPDELANGRQWRTPPLWGIGLVPDVNDHSFLLHDGRARNTLEAILWHGGEAEASRQQVLKMKREERDALVKFVNSL
ncbi:thiol oxidoreductase [Rhodoferax koreense]|uniref:Thiol oxidoreductase n=1 Tax=Rhodoferax koreensis TaxID=1842727 RepID=A0A1P8JZI5_9BURK|nr:di-heme oxidoredictase family protein [Rhodoferax koreense]APW39145.1 thiol oxidoreductase [Rhodoferax koreense]